MLYCYINLRNNYQLLYLRTLLSSTSFSRLNKSSFSSFYENSTSNINCIKTVKFFPLFFKKKAVSKVSNRSFSFFLRKLNLNVRRSSLRKFNKDRSFLIPFLHLFFNNISHKTYSPSSLRGINSLSLRISNLFLYSARRFNSSFFQENQFALKSLLKTYTSFFFLYTSSIYNEAYLGTFLKFLFSDILTNTGITTNSLFLNRFMLNSFFFISNFNGNRGSGLGKLFSSIKVQNALKSNEKVKRSINGLKSSFIAIKRKKKQKYASFIRVKRLMYLMYYKWSSKQYNLILTGSDLSLYEKEQKRIDLFARRKTKSFNFFLNKFPTFKRLKLYASSRLYSSFVFNSMVKSSYDSVLLYNFIDNISRFFLKSNILVSDKYKSSFVLSFFDKLVPMSTSFLFSFYKNQKFKQLNFFLKKVRHLKSKTFNLYINGTGSNYHSTFLKQNRVLFSKWSGLFGFKKRLKYRKNVAHKISYGFHRFISKLYLYRRVKKLNININGFYKFAEIFLDAFSRQIQHSANYALNIARKNKSKNKNYMKNLSALRLLSNSSLPKARLPRSIVQSFLFPLVSDSLFVKLNLNELRYVLPELSEVDLGKLYLLISNDNKLRSKLLYRWVRFSSYKNRSRGSFRKRIKLMQRNFNASSRLFARRFSGYSNLDRLELVNRLIGIFMIRYNISNKKDFYKAVSYLSKYKSFILKHPHIDSSDFLAAYSIIYLLKVLKQNNSYITKFKLYSRLLQQRFSAYLKRLNVFHSQYSSFKYKAKLKRKLVSFFYQKNKKNKKSLNVKRRKKSKFTVQNRLRKLKRLKRFDFMSSRTKYMYCLSELFNHFSSKLLQSSSSRKYILKQIYISGGNPLSIAKHIVYKLFKSFVCSSFSNFKNLKGKSSLIKMHGSRLRYLYLNHLKTLLLRKKKFTHASFKSSKNMNKRLVAYLNLSKILKMHLSSSLFPKSSFKHSRTGNRLRYLFSTKRSLVKFNRLLSRNLFRVKRSRYFRFSSLHEKRNFYRKALRALRKNSRGILNSFKKARRHSIKLKHKLGSLIKSCLKSGLSRFSYTKPTNRLKKRNKKRFLRYMKRARKNKISKLFRLIRTRMRRFIQVLYSVGYVKYRASLSHGGCVARKRYYDKRYLF